MKRIDWKLLIICLIIVYGIAFAGSLFTNTGEWYESVKPSITPPGYVFPIVWNILFFLIALSLYFAWTKSKKKDKPKIALVFGINLALNALWSFLFFTLQQPLWAFVDLIALWISIIVMIFTVCNIDKKSGWLLIPYLIWITFAGVLNYLIAF
ncbi:MAG: tryptophan-rich sensory protein [Nanoarchaeota archaeon]|nr:tryptophan-rich sensory protein [Nanoarchaeota archaeon]